MKNTIIVNSNNISINGESLDTILRHYKQLNILIQGLKDLPEGWKILNKWDNARRKEFNRDVNIEIDN